MQKKMNLNLKIQTSYNQLTKVEKKVADFVLAHPEKVIYMSISELASECDIGETSIYRFCRTLEFDGYQEFKMQLSLYLASNEAKEKKEELNDAEFERELINIHINAIKESYELLNTESLANIVELIEEAETVYFYGVGDSSQTAMDMWNRFAKITPKVRFISDAHMQARISALLSEKDLVFLISYSGSTKDTVNIAKIAHNTGAKIACITRYAKSPLTVYTDEMLLCGSNESPLEGGSLTVKMSQLYLIDLIYHKYYQRNQDISMENQEKTSRAVVDKLY